MPGRGIWACTLYRPGLKSVPVFSPRLRVPDCDRPHPKARV